jgi:hypothetical protein
MTRYLSIMIILCCFLFGAEAVSTRSHVEIRGMTVSCQTWGWEWGSDEMVTTMRELKQLGVNWIAIHPYARIHADGTVQGFSGRGDESFAWLTRPIMEAHRMGLKICIKPHLAYWGSKFRWRGDVAFDSPEQWDNFFASYSDWMNSLATICKEADAFVVATELDRTVAFESRWRNIIEQMRSLTNAPLTYASNWTDYRSVPFWDALDVIGIQAYFPLADSPSSPELDQLASAWDNHLKELNSFAAKLGKTIVFTELGYDLSQNAAFKPWESGRRNMPDEALQQKCLESALRAIERDDQVIGAFLWKWFPGDTDHENFLKSTPAMRSLIKSYWAEPASEL